MEIISHRGYWLTPEEKNEVVAFRRSFELNYGTETDVRDCAGKLLISHDPPRGGEIELGAFIHLLGSNQLTLALNVKADGLAVSIGAAMHAYDPARWFVFDMSIPDTRQQLAAGNPVFVRMSEHEPDPAFMDVAAGVWLDAFETDEWRLSALEMLLDRGKRICLVSPELHRRPHMPFWTAMSRMAFQKHNLLTLCTDLPEDATRFFSGSY